MREGLGPVSESIPLIFAYGRRWGRKHLDQLPSFEGHVFRGLYVLYNLRGIPIYTGISENIPARLARDHRKGILGGKWGSFSWFIINPLLPLRDVEALCIKGFGSLRYGAIRGRRRNASKFLGWNSDPSGFKAEKDGWRNYWICEGTDGAMLEAYNDESRSILSAKTQGRCRIKRGSGRDKCPHHAEFNRPAARA